MSIKIIIAGGGTGGHIFPALAVAQAIKLLRPDAEILFVGAKGKMEMEKVPQAGFDIKGLDIAGFNRSAIWKNISLPIKLVKSFLQARAIIRKFKPDAVFGVGGYSSFPVLRMAQGMGLSTYLHESNAFAGKSNILLGKMAKKIFVAAGGMERFFAADKLMVSGNPVRKNIAEMTSDRAAAKAVFGLSPQKPALLVVGGSLGAQSINEAVEKGLDRLEHNGIQLIWQTGKPFAERALAVTAGRTGCWAGAFITDMATAYAAADLVVSRSGAMSVAELCLVARPAIFVPYPFAAEDHQTANAMAIVNKGAALLVKNENAKEQLMSEVLALAANEQKMAKMADNIKTLARPGADLIIAKTILEDIK